jgi:hypothetical protein
MDAGSMAIHSGKWSQQAIFLHIKARIPCLISKTKIGIGQVIDDHEVAKTSGHVEIRSG